MSEQINSEVSSPSCPMCDDAVAQRVLRHEYTLVGGDPDPNHHTLSVHCGACGAHYSHQYKSGVRWQTDAEGYLLRGRNNCFESVGFGRERDDEAKAFAAQRCRTCDITRAEHPPSGNVHYVRRVDGSGYDDKTDPHQFT